MIFGTGVQVARNVENTCVECFEINVPVARLVGRMFCNPAQRKEHVNKIMFMLGRRSFYDN